MGGNILCMKIFVRVLQKQLLISNVRKNIGFQTMASKLEDGSVQHPMESKSVPTIIMLKE